MDLNLSGRTAIVTGGGSNIGRAIVFAFAKEGSNVLIADWDEAQAQKTADDVKKEIRGRVIKVKTDVTDWDQVQAMVKRSLDEFRNVDILVNNHGWGYDRLFIEQSREEWENMLKPFTPGARLASLP